MAYCPNCWSEYVEGVRVCQECGVAVVEKLPLEEKAAAVDDGELVEIFHGRFWQVALLRGLLDEQQISSVTYEAAPFGGLFGGDGQPPFQRLMIGRNDYEKRFEEVTRCMELVAEANEQQEE